MTTREFRLPDLGEGLTESDIVAWHVHAGDHVELNQVIAEVETAKALVDLPSPYAGVVATLHAVEGQTVNVGDPIVTFEVEDPATPGDGAPDDGATAGAASLPAAEPGVVRPSGAGTPHNPGFGGGSGGEPSSGSGGAPAGDDSDVRDVVEPNLVGYGALPDSTGRPVRRRRRAAEGAEPRVARQSGADVPRNPGFGDRPRSTPPVRALAKKLGVHIERVEGTGPDGLITRADVLAAVSCHRDVAHPTRDAGRPAGMVSGAPHDPGARRTAPSQPGHPAAEMRETAPRDVVPGTTSRISVAGADAGPERVPVRGVRKHTAAAMVSSAFTAPHATVFLTVDVTRSVELIDRLRTHRLTRDSRVTVLALVARALCATLARHPDLNSAWHDLPDGSAEIWRHHRVNLGIAVATDRGLVVPHVADADALDLPALADALAELVTTARAGRTPPERLTGGTISITNVGVFGVDAGTPILVPGEAAILGLGGVRRRPWEHDGDVALRDVVTLSLSFDHRVVDGEQGARFLADLGALLEDPGLALLGTPTRRTPGSTALDGDPAAQPGVRQGEGATA